MTKILHVLAQQPGQTGSGVFIESLIREANKKKYQQAVVVGVPSNKANQIPQYLPSDLFFPVLFETKNLPFPVVGMSDVMPYRSTRYRDLTDIMLTQWRNAFTKTLSRAVDQFQPDVVLSHHLWLLSGLTKELFPSIPMIVQSHGTGLRQLELASGFAEYVKSRCRSIEIILALNDFQKKKIADEYGIDLKKIIVTGSAYNSDIFYRADQKRATDSYRLVYAGKLSKVKGIQSLLRVYKSLPEKNKRMELTLIGSGSGDEEQKIREMAADSVHVINFPGLMPQEELANKFRHSDLFILPSFYEGLPLVVVEALASGLRIVTTDIPGLQQWLGPDINKSGFILYVTLPSMISIDQPVNSALPSFEGRLRLAIKQQLSRLDNDSEQDWLRVKKSIETKSWTRLFQKIEKIIFSLLG